MISDLKARFMGAAGLAAGLATLWFFIIEPLQQAQTGVLEIHYMPRAFAAIPFLLVFGLAYLCMGGRFQYRTADRKNFTPAAWVLFAISAALAGLSYWWFASQFAALGYS